MGVRVEIFNIMPKVKYHELTEDEKKKFLGEFYSIVASLKTRADVKNFLKDLLTLSEAVMISRRIQVAKMLLDEYTHEDIRKELKVGFTTISIVEKWLNNGFGGYKKVLREYKEKTREMSSRKEKISYKKSLLKKYPHHRIFLDLFK